jgi:hypothetical protein
VELAECPKTLLALLLPVTNGPGYCNIKAARPKKSLNATPRLCKRQYKHLLPWSACCYTNHCRTHICLILRLQRSGPKAALQSTRVLIRESPSVLASSSSSSSSFFPTSTGGSANAIVASIGGSRPPSPQLFAAFGPLASPRYTLKDQYNAKSEALRGRWS